MLLSSKAKQIGSIIKNKNQTCYNYKYLVYSVEVLQVQIIFPNIFKYRNHCYNHV